MARIRVLGPRALLPATVAALQDLELVHLAEPPEGSQLQPVQLTDEQEAERERLLHTVEDLGALHRRWRLDVGGEEAVPASALPAWQERARSLRVQVDGLDAALRALDQEHELLVRFSELVRGFAPLLATLSTHAATRAHYLVLAGSAGRAVRDLRRSLSEVVGDAVHVVARPLAAGGTGVVVLVPVAASDAVDALLDRASLDELRAPEAYGGGGLAEALPGMLARLDAIPAERDEAVRQLHALARDHGPQALGALRVARDRLAALDAARRAVRTERAFVIEGWVPRDALERVERVVEVVSPALALERVGSEHWAREQAPVKLQNPRLFRPFEAVTALMPLPAYGSLDPTPFVAVGFPMMFGIILGDVGYGLVLAVLAGVLRLHSEGGSRLRSISEIGLACALFTVVFGVLYGEAFGDLGRTMLGMHAVWLDREEAIVPALVLALGIGTVHVLLGMVLGVAASARHGAGAAVGRGLGLLMVVLVVLAVLAVSGMLPAQVFTPVLVVALVAFPALVLMEGLLAPIELLGTLANVLSYARIMAVGTASVMMAVVANRVAGAMGSVLVGALFALVFHVVNFAIGVFGPAVHVLRLHYVEFFGKFVSPGGVAYRPLGHWNPSLEPDGP